MKGFKVGQKIEVIQKEREGLSQRVLTLVILAFLTEGVLVTSEGAGSTPFPMFVKWDDVVMPKALPGVEYRYRGSHGGGIGLADGRIYNLFKNEAQDFTSEWVQKAWIL